MTDQADIRAWALEHGLDVNVKGPVRTSVMRAFEEAHPELHDDDAPPEQGPPLPPVTQQAERKPEAPPSPWWKRGRSGEQAAPKPRKRRVAVDKVASGIWSGLALLAARSSPQALPVARVLDMQAPVAGIVIEQTVKGSVVDRVLQPFARAEERGRDVMGLIGPPLLVGAITAKPELYPVLAPALEMSLVSWLEISEPAMRKAQARAAKFEERLGGLDVRALIDQIFAPPPGGAPPPETVAANGAAA